MTNLRTVTNKIRHILLVIVLLTPLLTTVIPQTAKADSPYEASAVLGQLNFTNSSPNGALPSADSLQYPYFNEVDEVNHRLFVSEYYNHRVVVYNLDSNNELLDATADYVLGQENFTSTAYDGPSASSFQYVHGLAYDSNHDNLFVVDRENNRILVFDTATITNGEDAINVLGQANFTDVSFHTTVNGLYRPVGLDYDVANDRLFVADDTNLRVLVFDTASISNNEDAINVLGQPDFDTRTIDTNIKGFSSPRDVAYDDANNRLFVTESGNHRVLVFDTTSIDNNEDAVNVLGQADFTTASSDTNINGFNNPYGLDYDSANDRLFVGDISNRRVLVFDTASISDNEDAVNVLGQADFVTNSSDINAKGFSCPNSIAYVASSNQAIVTDSCNNRVLLFDTASISNNEDAIDVIGQDDFISSGANKGSVNSSGFEDSGISPTIDTQNHRLYVTDSSNHRVLVFDLEANNELLDKTADYVLGQENFITRDSGADADSLNYPGATSFDSVNNLLFVTDQYSNCRVMVYDVASITNGEDAINILGGSDVNAAGDCTTSQSTFAGGEYYGSVAFDETTEKLYVTDASSNYRIMVFDLSGGITDGMNANKVLGASDFDNPGAGDQTATGLADDYSNLAIDSANQRLFYASYNQNRVLVFDVESIADGEPAVYVLLQDNLTDSDGTAQTGLSGPVGLGYDPVQQQLFVSDYSFARILIYDVNAISDGEDAIGVIGQPDFSSSDSGTSQSGITPYDQAKIAYDSVDRRLWYGDDANARVISFDFANITTGEDELPEATFGEPYDFTIDTTGTQGTVTCTLASGSLPDGVTLSDDCTISGTPASNTVYTFSVLLSDDNGVAGTFTDTQDFSLTVNHADQETTQTLADTGINQNLYVLIAIALLFSSYVLIFRKRMD
jgi:DNA-binding beta-propeller fold protein YncE